MRSDNIDKESQENEKLFRMLFDHSIDGIILADPRDGGNILSANQAACRMLGWSEEEIVGKGRDAIFEHQDPAVSALLDERVHHGSARARITYRRKDGTTFPGEVSTAFFTDKNGEPRTVAIIRDITESKQEEHKILRYNRILKGINQIFGNVIKAKTEEELGETCLSVALELTGGGIGFVNLLGEDGLMHDIAISEGGWEQCLMYDKTGHRRPPGNFIVHDLYGHVVNSEKGFFTNNPSLHHESIGLSPGHPPLTSFLCVPLVRSGKAVGMLGVANREGGYSCEQLEDLEAIAPAVVQALERKREEQERKRAEEALRESQAKLEAALASMTDAVFISDAQGHFIDFNDAFATYHRFKNKDECSKTFDEYPDILNVFMADGTPAPLDMWAVPRALRGERGTDAEYILQRKDTGETWFGSYNFAPIRNKDGDIVGSVVVGRDITRRKQSEDALNKAYEKLQRQSEELQAFNEELQVQSEEIQAQNEELQAQSEELQAQNEELQAQSEELQEANEELRESEEHFRTMANAIPQLAWIARDDGYIYWYNERWYAYTGTTPEQMEGWGWERVHDPAVLPEVLEQWRASIATGDKFDMVFPLRGADGIFRSFLTRVFPLKDVNGQVLQWFGTNTDITERKQLEDALKKAHEDCECLVEERTAELMEAYESLEESKKSLDEAQRIAHIGNWDWNIATNNLYWSDEIFHIFGRDPQEFGANYYAFLSSVHPDDREYVNNAVLGALDGNSYSIDHRVIRADGEERLVHEQGEIIFNNENIPVRMIGTVQDITEQKKTEEKIRHLASAVESSNDAIITESLDGIITSWNKGAEQVYGYSAEEVIGKPVSILELPKLAGETEKLNDIVKQGKKVQQYETLRLRKDGKTIYVSITVSPVYDFNKKLTAISVISRDITKRKEAEEALTKIEIARKQEIHHRIKNNLQVISSLLDLQAEKFIDRQCVKDSEILEAFRESQNRVISMTLIHEELHKGGGFETLNFSPYIKELSENLLHTYSIGNNCISLKLDLVENAFFDMDTAVPLGIIVNELVSNSFKHAFAGRRKGEIRIKLDREENGENRRNINENSKTTGFNLTVSDNGVGIPENLEIEEFDSLGLQLVISLVEQLDGEFELIRNNGTEFTLRFKVTEKF